MLKRLYVDNVRCLSNFLFEPSPGKVALLVGPNGGGKSTIYMVLGAIQEFLQRGDLVQQAFPTGSLTRWQKRRTQRIELDAEDRDGNAFKYTLQLRHPEAGTAPVVDEEELRVNESLVYRFAAGEVQLFGDGTSAEPQASFPFSPNRSFLPLLEPRPDNRLIMKFRDWLKGVWLFSLQPQKLDPVSLSEARALNRDGWNFVSWFRMVAQEKPQLFTALREDLTAAIPGLSQISLKAREDNPAAKYLKVDCVVAGASIELEFGELSDGQRALMILYSITYAVAGGASVLVFDEPDNYLADREIQPWLVAMREAMESAKATLLVISHHPEVIDYLAPDQVFRLWRGDEGPARIEVVDFELARTNGISASDMLRLEAP